MLEPASNPMKQPLAHRTLQLLKILITTDFFGPVLPSLSTMVQDTRLPKNIIQDALSSLELEGLIRLQQRTYCRVYPSSALKRHRIGIITHTNLFHNAYGVYQDFLIGIAESLARKDIQLTLAHDLNSFDAKIVAIEEMLRSGVTSLILLGRAEEELRVDLAMRKIPTVICGNCTFDQTELGAVCSDNFGGMRRMVRHVIEQGHGDIAYYTTDVPTHDGFTRRMHGYRETMKAMGLVPREEMIFSEPHSSSSARWAADVFMALARRPSAVVCGSDRDAYELISELHRSGMQVPNDVSITGFDNNLFYAISDLALTTMDIHGHEVGRIAGNYLLKEISQPEIPVRITVPTSLNCRNSVFLVK